MTTQLTKGAIEHVYQTKDTTVYPVLTVQLLELKKVNAPNTSNTNTADRYRTQISDGLHYMQALIAAQINELVYNNTLKQYNIVRITEYTVTPVSGKLIFIILNVSPNVEQFDHPIGNPVNVDTTSTSFNGMKQENKENISHSAGTTHSVKNTGAVIKTDPNPHNTDYQSINSLNPYQARWTIKARVTAKSELKQWSNQRGEGKLFSVDLLDASGGQIRATMFNDAVDKFYTVFEQDRVYSISKGQMKLANKKFSRLPNDYEITLNNDAEVIQLNDDDQIQTQRFNFSTIDTINTIDPNTFIDVIGIVTAVGQISSINSQKMQKELKKRSVTLTDQSHTSIELTLWNENAEKYNEIELADNPVLAVKQVKVSDFGGRSIGTTFQSQIFVNPDRPESGKLKAWFTSSGNATTYESITKAKNGTENAVNLRMNTERRPLSCITDDKLGFQSNAEYVISKAVVTVVRGDVDKVPWYNACPAAECNKKVTDNGNGMYRCEKCNKDYPNCVPRYVLSVMIADASSYTWLSLFDEHARKLLGYRASELADMLANGMQDQYKQIFKHAAMQQKIWRFRVKVEMMNDEQRTRCQAMQMEDIDHVRESKLLIDEINLYH